MAHRRRRVQHQPGCDVAPPPHPDECRPRPPPSRREAAAGLFQAIRHLFRTIRHCAGWWGNLLPLCAPPKFAALTYRGPSHLDVLEIRHLGCGLWVGCRWDALVCTYVRIVARLVGARPAAAAAVADLDPRELSDDQLLEVAAAGKRLAAWAESLTLDAVAGFCDQRGPAPSRPAGPPRTGPAESGRSGTARTAPRKWRSSTPRRSPSR